MIVLNKNNTTDALIVTLTEKKLLPPCFYLFEFQNVTTQRKITFFKDDSDDQSPFPERYNEFDIATASLFANESAGQWLYRVYETTTTANTNTTGLNLLESGKMLLNTATGQTIIGYQPTTTYKGYGG